ncbi:hypothetical protein AMTR_s00151p00082430 [Amborella trichopoda]|uniref:Uncharacterized protein n=1 Tax=Amborella trichopoda TaxID=13333 RepID=W1NJV5_AMBTC|nr:hypothetical protein AMTR_s00151p00082430 [Amborella trichopoda]
MLSYIICLEQTSIFAPNALEVCKRVACTVSPNPPTSLVVAPAIELVMALLTPPRQVTFSMSCRPREGSHALRVETVHVVTEIDDVVHDAPSGDMLTSLEVDDIPMPSPPYLLPGSVNLGGPSVEEISGRMMMSSQRTLVLPKC